MVYVINADAGYSRVQSRHGTQPIFTAITRSKAWVRFSASVPGWRR